MSFAKFVFDTIDFVCDPFQNCPSETRDKKKQIAVCKDIVYDESNPKVCTLDTYVVPKTGVKYPVIFEIHGGGFTSGDKKYRRGAARWWALNSGAMVVNVNYGLAPTYKFPEPIHHLVSAMNWVVDNAERLNLNLEKFIVTGDSAGGYYAAYLGALQNQKELQKRIGVKEMKGKFTATIPNCGIYDAQKALGVPTLLNIGEGVLKAYTGIGVKELKDYKYLDSISSANYIDKNYPPSFIIYAGKDFFCGGQGETMVAKLEELKIKHGYFASTKFSENHTFPLMWTSKGAKECNKKTLEWARKFIEDKL